MVEMTERMCRSERRYHCFKSQLLFIFPYKWFILRCQPRKVFRFLTVVLDKLSVIIATAKKLLYFEKVIQPSMLSHLPTAPIPYCLNLILMHSNAHCRYNQPQVSYCILMKFAFLWLQIQSRFQQTLDNPFHMANMPFLRVTGYQNIIPNMLTQNRPKLL
jgi:hypothetical protein